MVRRTVRVRAIRALAAALPILAAGFGVLFAAPPARAVQTVPYLINFQGRLTDNNGNVLTDGSYNVKFRIFDATSGGTNLWEGDRVYGASDHRVTVQSGLFNIQFGDSTQGDPALSPSLFNTVTYPNLYLEVELPTPGTATCASNACATWSEGAMTPRQPLAATPYAFNSDTLDGLDSSAFGQLTSTNTWTAANSFTPSSGVAITLKPAASTDSLDIQNSSGVTKAYFDANGNLNIAQTLQATTTNAVDLGATGTTFRTAYFGTSVVTPALNASSSGGTITTNLGTLQRTAAGGFSIDLKDSGTTTLIVTNSGGGVAGVSATGGLTIGTGQAVTVGSSTGSSVTCSSGQILNAIVVSGGVVTGGSCLGAGGGDQLVGTWSSQTVPATTNTQTTINFSGSANAAPSFNNGTHVLTLASNASRLIVSAKAGGGGGGSDGTANAVKASGGGGEGGWSQLTLTGSLASNYYLKVGGGGGGGASGGTNSGTGGSNSCFGTNNSDACTSSSLLAAGGSGGTAANAAGTVAGGAGGAAASGIGDVKVGGADGFLGTSLATILHAGAGGGQSGGAEVLTSAAGNNGASGGGGSGAMLTPAAVTSRAGGNGGDGYVTISVYITVAGTGSPTTLQSAYNNSSIPDITLAAGHALTVRDSSGGIGGNLFQVQDNGGTTNYFAVGATGISTSGTITANTTGSINGLNVNSGALSGVTGYTQTAGSFNQTFSTATAASGQVLGYTNSNAGAGVTVQGIKITPANTTPSSGTNNLNLLDFAAGSGTAATAVTNGINFESTTGYTNLINSPDYAVSAAGDQTAAFTNLGPSTTTNGSGSSSTTMVLTSATGFVVGNYVQLSSNNCGGTGVNPCYAKITNIATNTLTITPALSWTNNSAVVQYHLPEIGGVDTSQPLANRYGRGYFISGVAAGNGTTYYNEDSISTNLSAFNLLNDANLTTLSIGNSATSVSLPGSLTVAGQSVVNGSGQINGAQLQAGTVANGALTNSSLTVTAGNGLTGGGSVSLGSSTSLAVAYGSAANTAVQGNTTLTCSSTSGNLSGGGNTITLGSGGTCSAISLTSAPTFSGLVTASNSGATALSVTGTPQVSASSSLVQIGPNPIASGNNTATTGGTYLGLNAPSSGAGSTADFINFQNNGAYKFKVTGAGLLDAIGGVAVNGTTVINSSGVVSGSQLAYGSTSNTAVQGNVTLVCPGTSGNLSGGGNTITLGAGGTCNSISLTNSPTFSGLISANGGVTLGGGQNLALSSGAGTISQTYSNNSGTAATYAVTNSGNSGTNTVTGVAINPAGTNTSGTNNTTGLAFGNVTNPGGTNNYYGLNFGTGYTSLLTYNGSGTVIINGSGQLNGAQIQNSTVANGALTNSTVGVTAGTGLTGGASSVALGSSTSLSVDQTAALSWTGAEQFNKSGGVGAQFNGSAASGGAQLLFGGVTALASGNANGTYIGANPASYTGDILNFAINSVNKLKVDNSGNLTAGGNLSAGSGGQIQIGGTQISSANLSDSSSITKQGNTFNGASQLVQLNGSTQLPAVSGNLLTNLNPSNLTTGTGAVTLQAGSTAQNINITPSTTGSVVIGGTTPTITAGSGVNLAVDTTGSAQLNLGAANATTVNLGNTASATNIIGGTAANAINLAPTTNGGIMLATTGTGVVELDSASSIIAQSTTNTTTAFQVQNAGGVSMLNIDTSTGAAANLLSDSGFEKNPTTNWTNLSAGSFARVTTQSFSDFASAQETTSTAAANGIQQAVTLSTSTQYTLSFYAKADASTPSITDLRAGYSSTGAAGGEVNCTLTSTTIINTGWNRYICTFTTPGTTSGSPYIYIGHTTTTNDVFYLDAVQLETGSFASPYGQGQLTLNATVNSPVNFQETANSSTAFQITNSAGTNILNVDTFNNNQSNQATNPSFESGTTGWAARAGCTFTQDNTTGYNGTSSSKCVTSATTSAGMNLTGISPVMVNGTTYTLALYAKSSAAMTTLEIGHSDTGLAANDTACLTAQSVSSLGWKRFTCTWTAGAQSGTPYIYVKQTDAAIHTFWVDAVTLETDANASTNYRDGRISLGNATISSPAVFQTNTNSSTAFQIQNAAGIQVFDVDTAGDPDLVTNSGFEVNSVGWSTMNGATGLVRDTTKTYVGIASGKVTTAVTANSGMRYTFSAALPANATTAYTISAYVETSVADSTFTLGYNSGSDVACAPTPTPSATVPTNTGWTRFTCSTPVNTALNSIWVSSGTTAVTLNVDGVQVVLGSVAPAFGNSNITFNGIFTSPVNVRSPNDTTTEFQVQNAASTNLFTVDSLNKNVQIGSATTDTTQVDLQLDSSSTFTETATCGTSTNQGAMYYNTNSNTVRSCVGGNWEDIVTTSGLGLLLFGVVPDSGSGAGDLGSVVSAAVSGPCKVSWASGTTVTISQGCTAYSGGRKVTIANNTVPSGSLSFTNNRFVHVCLNGTNGQPAFSASGTEAADMPTFSANNPVLCLADIATSNSAITAIYDVRTFTTTRKTFATLNAATGILGGLVSQTTTANVVQLASATTQLLRGVTVATAGAAATNNTVNMIIANGGPQYVKATGTAQTAGTGVLETTTAGYSASGTASATAYATLGLSLLATTGTCTAAATCIDSQFTDIDIR